MAAVRDPDLPSSSSPQIRRSVHRALGGGAVADVLLWRRRNSAILTAAGATSLWFLFDCAGYNFLSLLANAFLLLVVILFFWAKSATLLNRPLPPMPNLEVSNEAVTVAADRARVWINRVLAVGHDIAIKSDRKLFLQVILGLWAVSFLGGLFNFITLVYIGVLLAITVPVLYEMHQDSVNEKLNMAHNAALRRFGSVLNGVELQSTKQKKIE